MTEKSIDIIGQSEDFQESPEQLYESESIKFAIKFLTIHVEERPFNFTGMYRVERSVVYEQYLSEVRVTEYRSVGVELFEKLARVEFPTMHSFLKRVVKCRELRRREPLVKWHKGKKVVDYYRMENYEIETQLWDGVRFYRDKLGGHLVFGDIC